MSNEVVSESPTRYNFVNHLDTIRQIKALIEKNSRISAKDICHMLDITPGYLRFCLRHNGDLPTDQQILPGQIERRLRTIAPNTGKSPSKHYQEPMVPVVLSLTEGQCEMIEYMIQLGLIHSRTECIINATKEFLDEQYELTKLQPQYTQMITELIQHANESRHD